MAKKKHAHKKHTTHKTHAHHAHKSEHAHTSEHKTRKSKPVIQQDSTLKNVAIIIGIILLVLVVIIIYQQTGKTDVGGTNSGTSTSTTTVTSAGEFEISEEIKMQMEALADDDPFMGAEDAPVVIVEFSDFQCPYCARFQQQTLGQLKENFVDTGVVKIVYRDLALSFHANAQKAAEAAQCAHDQGKFWEYHDTLFANTQKLDVNSLKSYAIQLGLDAGTFNECLDSGKYTEEVKADAAAAQANGISGTPGFVINGQKLSGAQPYDKFEQTICAIVPESEPCMNVEPPKAFEITIVNDKACTSCSTTQLEGVLKNLFPGASFVKVDSESSEGQDLIEEYGLVMSPAYIFPNTVTETKSWETNTQMRGAFEAAGEGYRLIDEATGAKYYFDDAVREEQMAAINTALGLETGDNKPQVDFFVMSYCPYGNQAEELLKPVFDELKDYADFNPRYVVYNRGTGCYTDDDGTQLCSLHGEVELNQNIRELCVNDLYGIDAWFDFAIEMNSACNSNNADTCWTGVAEDMGYDTDAVQSCFEENKLSYARADFDLNQMLGVSGSPTIFFEGELYNGARTANGYLAALCAGFDGDKPAGCDNVVEESVAAPAQGSC